MWDERPIYEDIFNIFCFNRCNFQWSQEVHQKWIFFSVVLFYMELSFQLKKSFMYISHQCNVKEQTNSISGEISHISTSFPFLEIFFTCFFFLLKKHFFRLIHV